MSSRSPAASACLDGSRVNVQGDKDKPARSAVLLDLHEVFDTPIMKARITFILDGQSDFNPSKLKVAKDSLNVAELPVVLREDRVTLSLDEIEREVKTALLQTHELHLRWQSPNLVKTVQPYSSRIAPGLHVYYTPSKRSTSDGTAVCPALKHLFDLDLPCVSPNETFVQAQVVSSRFASTSSLQYFALLPNLERLAAHIALNICEKPSTSSRSGCLHLGAALNSADALDADYDAISSTLTLRILRRAPSSQSALWSEIKPPVGSSVEVGVLSRQDAAPGDEGPEKLSMGGYITMVGEDSKSSPTLFSFPSRHHPAQAPYSMSFNSPTGLHPTMRLDFPSGTQPPANAHKPDSCRLHAYLTLPKHIFPDKYQLAAPNFLKANGLSQIRSLTTPGPDLEAPDWAVTSWGSNLLIELDAFGTKASAGLAWHAEIPLHLRYLKPTDGGFRTAQVPWPAVFWACSSDEGGAKMSVNPFDRTDIGYDGAFGTRTVFYHLQPRTNATLVEQLAVPVLDDTATGHDLLQGGTAGVLVLGLAWVLWKLLFVPFTRKDTLSKARRQEKKVQ